MRLRDFSPLLLVCVALTGCGDEEGRRVNGEATPGPTASPTSSLAAAEIPFYACMEQHGLALVRTEDGAPRVADKDDPRFGEANKACAPLLPSRPPVQAAPQELAAALKASECMRAQGVDWYPDPDPVTGEVNQATAGTAEQWATLKKDHIDAFRKCMPRP